MVSIRRFGVIRTSNVAALIYFILSFIVVIPLALLLAAAPQIPVTDGLGRTTTVNIGASAIFLLLLPFIYGIGGWILTALGCLLYNVVASFTVASQWKWRVRPRRHPLPPSRAGASRSPSFGLSAGMH